MTATPTDSTSEKLRRIAARLRAKASAEAEGISICARLHDKAIHMLNVELKNALRDAARYRQELEALRETSTKSA